MKFSVELNSAPNKIRDFPLLYRVFFGLTGANFVTFTIIFNAVQILLAFFRTNDSKSLCSNFIIIIINIIIQYISIII